MRRIAGIVALVAVVAGCGSRGSTEQGVALVEGHTISVTALQRNLAYAASFYAWAYGNPGGKGSTCTLRSSNAACVVMRKQVLARLLEEQIVAGYAAAHHISLSAADLQIVREDALQLISRANTVAQLLAEHRIDRGFITALLEREALVRKVELAVTAAQAAAGPSDHLVRYTFTIGRSMSRGQAYQLALNLATNGVYASGSAARVTRWIAPSRLPAAVRAGLAGAKPGQFAGPFAESGGYVVFKLLGRGLHRYGRVAREARATQLFRIWLKEQLQKAAPSCFDSSGRRTACPPA